MSDFVAEGLVSNQVWVADSAALRLSARLEQRMHIARRAGKVTVRGTDAAFQVADSMPSSLRQLAAGAALENLPAIRGPAAAETLNGRRIATHRIGDKQVTLVTVPEAGRPKGRPPRAMVVELDGRIAAITEYTWARRAGAWRPVKSRTSLIGPDGRATVIADQDATALAYRTGNPVSARAGALRRAGSALAALGNLVSPDALYAATEEEWCIKEGLLAAAAADAALSECLERQKESQVDPEETTTSGPSDGTTELDCGENEEEWCEWTLSWYDGTLRVTRNRCWCEGEYAL